MPRMAKLHLNSKLPTKKLKLAKGFSNTFERQDNMCPNKCWFSNNKSTVTVVGCRKGVFIRRAESYVL